MKLIPVHRLIKDKSLLMIDDSIVRGTQLRETTEFFTEMVQRKYISVLRVRLYFMDAISEFLTF